MLIMYQDSWFLIWTPDLLFFIPEEFWSLSQIKPVGFCFIFLATVSGCFVLQVCRIIWAVLPLEYHFSKTGFMLCKLGRAAVTYTWNDLCMTRIALFKLKYMFLIRDKCCIGTLKVLQVYCGSICRLDICACLQKSKYRLLRINCIEE